MARQERSRVNISIRVKPSTKRKLERLAKADHERPLGSYTRKVLENHVAEMGDKDDAAE